LQTYPKNSKFKIQKRGNGRRKVVRVLKPCWSFRDGGVKVWMMIIKGMESRGKMNRQIELRKTFIGRMGFIHE
jgi:hypothetical protein